MIDMRIPWCLGCFLVRSSFPVAGWFFSGGRKVEWAEECLEAGQLGKNKSLVMLGGVFLEGAHTTGLSLK